MLTTISESSVLKAEVVAAAALVGFARDWHAANESVILTDPVPNVPFQLACHYFAGDATNNRVWHGSKVHSVEVRSSYILDGSVCKDAVSVAQVARAMNCHSFLADAQVHEG